jgi:Cys-tRNA(Pro)/Cys-tRNA(Cys) deacylase
VGYERVLNLIHTHGVPWDILEHGPVSTIDDVLKLLNLQLEQMVKSVAFALRTPQQRNVQGSDKAQVDRLCLVALPADRKVDTGKVARLLAIRRSDIHFATAAQVELLTGFGVGSIPPFGLPPEVPVMLDQKLLEQHHVWCGTGKPTESLRISIDNLRKLGTFIVADVSSPRGPYLAPPNAIA